VDAGARRRVDAVQVDGLGAATLARPSAVNAIGPHAP
jgi:hypothetical protein